MWKDFRIRLNLAVLFLTFLGLLGSQDAFSLDSKIAPWLEEHSRIAKEFEFIVVMSSQADLSPAISLRDKNEKALFVRDALWNDAQRSQSSLQSWLRSKNISFRSFYIVNALLIRGNRDLMHDISKRSDVARIEGNPEIRNTLPLPESINVPFGTDAIEWSISKTKAPDLWALGFTGQGIVVGGGDTGYRWTHNAIKGKYRGWNGSSASHDYNWHDAIRSGGGICGANSAQPCDDSGHGTHTMGTVVGDDGGSNQIGMAPGAQWIGCRNMNQGNGTPATYLECFEFFLAPYPVGGTPAQGDPTKAPDITTNSWGCPASEGCSDLTLEQAVNAQKAAGILTVVAAGNAGPSCNTVDDAPSLYDSSYTVGSTTISDSLSGFSSRGEADTTLLIKPEIVAPGSDIRSASSGSDSGYVNSSGTSMAAPNIAGGIALLWSALPDYKNHPEQTEALINESATKLTSIVESCGGDYVNGPNNSWGYGLLDVLSAYNSACIGPAAPANLTSLPGSGNDVSLNWNPVATADQYEISRGDGSCPGTGIKTIVITTSNSFLDTNTLPGLTYSYTVRAIQSICSPSQSSNCASITVSSGSLLFQDDFNDGDSIGWTYKKGSWSASTGDLIGSFTGKTDIVSDFVGCSTCTVETTIQMGSAGRAALLSWYTDKSDYVELAILEAKDKVVLKQRKGSKTVLKKSASKAIDAGVAYKLKIAFNGTQFQVFLDDVQLFQIAAPGSASGTVGFRVRSSTAVFREILVY